MNGYADQPGYEKAPARKWEHSDEDLVIFKADGSIVITKAAIDLAARMKEKSDHQAVRYSNDGNLATTRADGYMGQIPGTDWMPSDEEEKK